MKNLKTVCLYCGAITSEYVFKFDILDASLLIAMGNRVRERCLTMPFTQANDIHVPSLDVSLQVQCRTTIASKLGLVAKVRNDAGRHQRGHWLVTARGWAALRGESVPAEVRVFRKQITERPEQKITLQEALRKGPNAYYDPEQWVEYGNRVLTVQKVKE